MPFILFILLPFIELWFLIKIGAEIGALTTILLLIMAGIVGMQLLRIEGVSTLLKLNQKMAYGEDVSQEAMEGLMLALSGALFLFPGFISDMVAIVLLIPFTRRLIVRRWLKRHTSSTTHFYYQNNDRKGDVFEGEFREVDREDKWLDK
jgi:UPF0716 protein FxsA